MAAPFKLLILTVAGSRAILQSRIQKAGYAIVSAEDLTRNPPWPRRFAGEKINAGERVTPVTVLNLITFRGSLLTLLAAIAVATAPGLAQDGESRPIDPAAVVELGSSQTTQTLNYCEPEKKRALVLSGGGLKGAFQAGAVYHFIVHRRCDFSEIAGVSVGSLNAAVLAQAERDENPEASLKNMADRAEKLVDVWHNIRSSKQILKPRWPGWMWALAVRYGLFGTESMNTFDPLMHLIENNVDMDALDRGRPVRVGSVSLWDGTYREVGPSATFPNNDRKYFLQYVYASALIPIIGKTPRIQQSTNDTNVKEWIQFADGGILNNTPIFNYFRKCEPQDGREPADEPACLAWLRPGTPPPQNVQQLFVVVTAPFTKGLDRYPVAPKLLDSGSKQVTDGRKILLRTIDLILETDFREDLTLMLESNAILGWRKRTYDAAIATLTPEQRETFDLQFAEINRAFPLHSYNEAPDGGPSLPYDAVVVAPEKVYSETFDVDPENIALQLHYGCLQADLMMQQDFHMTSMKQKCEERFPLWKSKPAQPK